MIHTAQYRGRTCDAGRDAGVTGASASAPTATTSGGVAELKSAKNKTSQGDVFEFTVTGVTGSDLVYVPGNNVVTARSIAVP